MKKIGILFGKEETFPQAFIDRVNSKGLNGIEAEAVNIDMVEQGAATDYSVIIDRISQDVPYYRAYLKNAALSGTAVINNPFWWSADEKFFNNALALKVGVPVPKTVILPSHERPDDTGEMSFRNLKFPYAWEKNFEYVGFPAYMKPHDGGGWKNVYRVENADDLFAKHSETGQLVMLLQEEIEFTEYFRCYVLGGNNVHIMQYEPRNPHHLRYVKDAAPVAKAILAKVKKYCIDLNQALGYDFNTVEFAIKDGIPYAIDFCNPAPDADVNSVGQANFDWIVENAAQMAIAKAKQYKEGKVNLTWGSFVANQIASVPVKKPLVKKAPAKKAPARKVAAKKPTATKTAAVKPATVKKEATKPVASKAAAVKAPAAKKSSTRRATTKTTAAKVITKKTPAKKATVNKTAATKRAAVKATSAKPAAKKTVAAKPATKKASTRKTTARAPKK